MAEMKDDYSDVEVVYFSEDDVNVAKATVLKQAGYTWPQLQEHAKAGCFPTETARRAWFVVSSLI